jgi:hypothetical protein
VQNTSLHYWENESNMYHAVKMCCPVMHMNKYSTVYGVCIHTKIINLVINACIKQKSAYNRKTPCPRVALQTGFSVFGEEYKL